MIPQFIKNRLPQFLRNRRTVALLLVIAALALTTPVYIGYEYYESNPKFCTSCHLMNGPYELWRQGAMGEKVSCHTCHELSPPASMNLVYMQLVENPTEIKSHADVKEEVCLKCHAGGDVIYPQIEKQVGHQVHYFQGNQTCLNCHNTNLTLHQFSPPENICQRCHEQKQQTAGMANLDCRSCHSFTEEGKDTLVPTKADCVSCHARIQSVMAIPAAAHQDSQCSTCHQLHNSSKPAQCTSCHDTKTLPGLHQAQTHLSLSDQKDCQRCHVPHQQAEVRAVCTTCHSSKITHNPGVECNICHQFKSA